jgi:hypothetical protein
MNCQTWPDLAAWIPFLHPVKLPPGARLWMFFPLILCVALVYRATRSRSVRDMPRATVGTFAYVCIGMIAIAVAFYLLHRLVLWLS